MPNSAYVPLLEIFRGSTLESIHFGAAAVADAHGRLLAWVGDPQVSTFLRSSAKPFQALPFIENGGKEKYGLSDREVALICASHSGTDDHVNTLEEIQAKAGVSESELMCGVHPPFHIPTANAMLVRGEQPTSNRHNCSGKHSGMLAYVHMGKLAATEANYIDLAHPLQQQILQTFAEMCGLATGEVELGVDGCSVPTFAVPLVNAAMAYARLFDPVGLSPQRAEACQKITRAMTCHPDMVGGPDSFDTALMAATKGRLLAKTGAEGYQAIGLPAGAMGPGSPAVGITLKISDGDLGLHTRPWGHARPPVMLEILRQIGAIRASELEALKEWGPSFKIHNWRKIEVGYSRPAFTLQRSD